MTDAPAVVATQWNLIAAGPSRAHLSSADLLEGPVVTVNRAIDIMERGILVDFAAFADTPAGYWKPLNLERHLKPGMQIWLSPAHITAWDQQLPAWLGIRPLPFGTVPDIVKIKKHAMEALKKSNVGVEAAVMDFLDLLEKDIPSPRAVFTTLAALERIFLFRPTKVRLLCADMDGAERDGQTVEDFMEDNKKRLSGLDRWQHERLSLGRAIRMVKAGFGCEVEFYTPRPEESFDGALVH